MTGVDVCVVGGGPGGVAAALGAHAGGATVCLVAPPGHRAAGAVELLSGRARRTLATLGLLDVVCRSQRCTGTVSRWSGSGFDERSALLDPDGGGWIVDRAALAGALRESAARRGVEVVAERAAGVGADGRVHLRGRTVTAGTVVIAVGGAGGPARQHIRRRVRRRIVALEASFAADAVSGLGRRLLVDRAPHGWWYALADATRTHVAYCTDADELASGMWQRACASATDWLPAGAAVARPRVRSAAIGTAVPVAKGAIRLVGDVALAVDPLSGHGIALALEGGLRCRDDDYADWVAHVAGVHAAAPV